MGEAVRPRVRFNCAARLATDQCSEPHAWYRRTLTRLPPDDNPGVGTLSRNCGSGGT